MTFRLRMREIALLTLLMMAVNASAATRRRHRVHSAASSSATAKRAAAPRPASSTARAAIHRRLATGTSATLVATTTTHGVIHSRSRYSRRRAIYSPWTEPTFADSTIGDITLGEDPVVRKAAVDALGHYNGSIVVVDPQTGRILSMVNQKLAMTGAFEPCSTIKIVVSLASLSEKIVDPDAPMRITRRSSINLTRALAISNNAYFAKLGEELGFDRVHHYAQLFGLGETAGLDLEGEEPGTVVDHPPTDGLGMMTSFGSGIQLTPLELASIVATVANGGTMYYLQCPRTADEVQKFEPKVKRYLDIANLVPSITPGMMGAVEYGTARRASFNQAETVLGKTGT
ncbi:MAG: penicillin-binding transpeptidase domain-containing protein, partial [Bryobacteraceae bacterium]